MENSPASNPGIINHVPSTEEIQAARQIEATHDPDDAMPREMVDLVLLGAGVQVDRSAAQAPVSPAIAPAVSVRAETPASEPFIEPEGERTISGAEHKKLLEELFGSGK